MVNTKKISKMNFVRIVLVSVFFLYTEVSIYGQDHIICHINERDSSLYHSRNYIFEHLEIRNLKSSFYDVINKLSENDSSEMYIARIQGKKIIIQNWGYVDMNDIIQHTNVYGMLRMTIKNKYKDFLLCYNDDSDIPYVKKICRKKRKRISIFIHIEKIPKDIHIVSNDLTTYYVGLFTKKGIQTQNFIFNNKKLK